MTKPIRPLRQDVHAVVLVAAEERWRDLRNTYETLRPGIALGREFLSRNFGRRRVVFVHTGEGAVEAAVSAQYAVDRWTPHVLACDGGHDLFDHVAMRNGLALTQVDELGLSEPSGEAAQANQTEPQRTSEEALHEEDAAPSVSDDTQG